MQLVDFHNSNEIQSDAVRKCIEFACKNNLQATPIGRYDIEGDAIYVAISEYQTVPSEVKVWEAHREYIDLQMIIEGEELIEVSPLSEMNYGEYVSQNDFLQCYGEAKEKVLLREGLGLLLCPEDGHKPGVIYKEAMHVKKAVFKIHRSRMRRR